MPILKIEPPLGGIGRKASYQRQADSPFEAYDASNFWPVDPKSGRLMLATRPPLQSVITPSGTPPLVNMIAQVNGVRSGFPFESLVIAVSDADGDSDGALHYWNGSSWTAATGAQAAAVDDDRAIYAASLISDTYIPVASAKPIRFRYTTGAAATLVETAGTCPTDNRIAVAWQGALVLAGNKADPNIVYVSRIGDPLDWDFTAPISDTAGAFFTSGEDEARISGPITALIPQTAETLIVSTVTGLLAMRGHPRRGGVFEPIGGNAYALGQGAWTKIPGDVLFFLAPQGFFFLEPSPNAIPTPLSDKKIPFELLGLSFDIDDPTISMVYDSRFNGVIITDRKQGQEQAWLYDLSGGGFYRMRFESYPFVFAEFTPFLGNFTSGVLHGRYDGLKRFDIFGTEETIHSSAVIGPLRISSDDQKRSRIQRLRVLFGRDTPSSDTQGTFRVAGGVDGQDALSKLLRGEHQYETPLSTFMAGNNDACYPLVSGGAAVVGITTEGGDVAIEQMTADINPQGFSPFLRGTQLSVTGTPSATITSTNFDPLIWAGYSEATPVAPSCASLPDHTCFIDLSELPASWWAQVSASGGDVRATDNNNVQVPLDLIYFDKVNSTGFATVKITQGTTPTPVRVWVGRRGMALPPPTDTFGQYNAYDTNWRGFWPSGGGDDRTSLQKSFTHVNSTNADSAGPIGVPSTDYDEANHGSSDAYAFIDTPGVLDEPVTLVAFGKRNASGTSLDFFGIGAGLNDHCRIYLNWNGTTDVSFTRVSTVDGVGNINANSSESGELVTTWQHVAGTFPTDDERNALINGGGKGTNSTARALSPFTQLLIGRARSKTIPSTTYNGKIALAQIHDTERSDCWLAYQAAMRNQSTFWPSGWGEFVVVNEAIVEPPPPASACPSGIVAVSETGTWTGYDELTADPVPANTEGLTALFDFSHWIDLSNMSATWWSNVASDGSDIRATDTSNVFLPLDLVLFNKVANTGLAVVRATSTTTAGVTVRLWAGNGSAVTVPACAAYGRYRAYKSTVQGFWPSGAGTDRTAWGRDMTASGGFVEGAIGGPVGNQATRYDGVDDFSTVDTTPASGTSATDSPPLSLFTVMRVNAPDIFHVAHPIDITKGDGQYYALHLAADVLPFLISIHATSDQWKSSQEVGVLDTWVPVTCGLGLNADGNVIGRIVADDSVDVFEGTQTGLLSKLTGLNRFNLGAFRSPDGTPQLEFDGDLTLCSLHSEFLPEAWSLYSRLMLTQATFWTTPTWTASSSTLPQP